MPDESSKKLARRRINQVGKTLRQFGISDPGDVADLLSDPPFPTLAVLEKRLKKLNLRLPSNVSARFVAESLIAAVSDAAPATLKWRETYGDAPNLAGIKTGATLAGKYHRTIFDALRGIFDGALANGRIEQEINTGIHRVDIMFDNFADSGFFSEVRSRLKLNSNYVPPECKNYTDDIGSPEYDQLGGRLNKENRQVGLLVVRKIIDKNKSFEHVKAKWAKGELILIFDDEDVLRMHKARHDGQTGDVDALLWNKVRSLTLNSAK